jgi:1-deoxy-D-xylulose-5-phosphate reductoisomerase
MKRLTVLGATGSIGTSTLAIVEAFPARFEVVALSAGRNLDRLRQQVARHRPAVVAVEREDDAMELAREFAGTRFVAGADGLDEVAGHETADMVVAALVGSVGLAPTLSAIRAGKDVALANKETLVAAGDLVMSAVESASVSLLPVDSEHNALFQALQLGSRATVARLVLTASGGPFRTWSEEDMQSASVDDALGHPTWRMGPKITVDSATMMNKGLEIIEAHHLFAVPENKIDVIVHPESLVHSMVEFVDGVTIALLSVNDMRVPILSALAWPERLPSPLPTLDLAEAPPLTFDAPDMKKFPALGLARSALREGGELPAVLNAANEVAVAAFLGGRCPLSAITATVAATLDRWSGRNRPLATIEQVFAADREGRAVAGEELGKFLREKVGSNIRCS